MLLIQPIPWQPTAKGVLAWYGADYDLEDFLVYLLWLRRAHAQMAVFRDNLAG
ncbi:MAG: hypothetical protein IPL78_33850 [Chloroflexi bacterium]|nr:hypothetical protein [Chloroflexota bacterium]